MNAETIARDVTGGHDLSIDRPTAGTPDDTAYREGINVWIWDDAGNVCFPRMGIESVGANWDSARTLMFNCATPDGRVLTQWEDLPPHSDSNDVNDPRIIGAGPMRFECIEPFSRWKVSFDGKVEETSLQNQIVGRGPAAIGPANRTPGTVALAYELELNSVCPPWFQGSLGGKDYVPGENRFEQLHRVTGTVSIEGKETPFSGGALRIHRKGANRTPQGHFFGHVWHSAFFPSGRAFGFIHYYPYPDGKPKFCEGWAIEEDGQMVPAEILDRPWLQTSQVHDDTFSFIIRTARGESRVTARTHASCFAPQTATFPDLQQGIGEFRWQGEQAYGTIERSTWRYPSKS